jgi:hypothetical protein
MLEILFNSYYIIILYCRFFFCNFFFNFDCLFKSVNLDMSLKKKKKKFDPQIGSLDKFVTRKKKKKKKK